MSALDAAVERLSRRAAARSTRRTFLARVGQTAVLVAGGPALATLLVERAEARVCGQSGVAPQCPTFDCEYPDSVWGWCWYASPGCCAGGGLKKICDCCTADWPFVHGYCPSGYNVRCIVESCHADPRVMDTRVVRALGTTAAAVAISRSRHRSAGSGGRIVLATTAPLEAAVAGPVAAHLGAPLLLSSPGRLLSGVVAEAQRLRATGVVAVGRVPDGHLDELASYGVATERAGTTSLEVARWLLDRTDTDRAVCVEPTGVSASCAAAAAAAAGQRGMPLVVGVDAARRLGLPVTWLVGPEAAAHAGDVAGGFPIRGATREEVALALADATVQPGDRSLTLKLVPSTAPDVAVGLAGEGGVLLHHPPGGLGPTHAWIVDHEQAFAGAVVGGTIGTLDDRGIYDLQSALNHFDAHLLVGVAGQGLPVISQPRDEREVGRARIKGTPPEEKGSYWSSRANPDRRR